MREKEYLFLFIFCSCQHYSNRVSYLGSCSCFLFPAYFFQMLPNQLYYVLLPSPVSRCQHQSGEQSFRGLGLDSLVPSLNSQVPARTPSSFSLYIWSLFKLQPHLFSFVCPSPIPRVGPTSYSHPFAFFVLQFCTLMFSVKITGALTVLPPGSGLIHLSSVSLGQFSGVFSMLLTIFMIHILLIQQGFFFPWISGSFLDLRCYPIYNSWL